VRVGAATQPLGLRTVDGSGVARPTEQLVVVAEVVAPVGTVARVDAVDEIEAERASDQPRLASLANQRKNLIGLER
jgi:hypothetical protein